MAFLGGGNLKWGVSIKVTFFLFCPFHCNFKQLEEDGLPLIQALNIMEKAKDKIASIPGSKGLQLQMKINDVIAKDPWLSTLKKVANVLNGSGDTLPDGIGPGDIAKLNYCSTVNVDVERSFSTYKNILTDRCQAVTEENISKVIVSHCYYVQKSKG